MEIVYVNDVYKQIVDAAFNARRDGKEIDYISVTVKEMQFITKKLKKAGLTWLTTGDTCELAFDDAPFLATVKLKIV